MGIARLDEGRRREVELGHLRGRWTYAGEAAGCVKVGVRRLELPAGSWSTPAHQHGRDEEIFYVLSGRGLSWQGGDVCEVGPGDCIVYLARGGAHTLHALEPLDVLTFGDRHEDESVSFPRLGMSFVGTRMADSIPGMTDGMPTQFVREAELGPPPLPDNPPAAWPRPPTVVNVEDVEAVTVERSRIARTRRNLGRAAGSVNTGIQHVQVVPGKESAPAHCHSIEEEIFVILDGDGVVVLGQEEFPVRAGHVVARPAGTGVAHVFRAGPSGLTYLAYGMRDPADVCFYPRSNKVAFRGIGVIARVERLEYWDGED
ncbi:MAG: cupin domain-containing protein [Solirubrobacteraceae bacterium]